MWACGGWEPRSSPLRRAARRGGCSLLTIISPIANPLLPPTPTPTPYPYPLSSSQVKIHPASINSKSALFRAVCSKPMQFMGYQDLVSVNQTLHEVHTYMEAYILGRPVNYTFWDHKKSYINIHMNQNAAHKVLSF